MTEVEIEHPSSPPSAGCVLGRSHHGVVSLIAPSPSAFSSALGCESGAARVDVFRSFSENRSRHHTETSRQRRHSHMSAAAVGAAAGAAPVPGVARVSGMRKCAWMASRFPAAVCPRDVRVRARDGAPREGRGEAEARRGAGNGNSPRRAERRRVMNESASRKAFSSRERRRASLRARPPRETSARDAQVTSTDRRCCVTRRLTNVHTKVVSSFSASRSLSRSIHSSSPPPPVPSTPNACRRGYRRRRRRAARRKGRRRSRARRARRRYSW